MGTEVHQPLAETRSATLFRHLNCYFQQTGTGWQALSEGVREIFHARTPVPARDIQFSDDADVFKRADRNGRALRKFFDPDETVRAPIDLEEAIVLALPDPFRADCRRDLAARYGLLDVPLPDVSGITDVVSLGRITAVFSDLLRDMAPTVDSGKHTAEQLVRARAELDQLISAAEGLAANLQRAADTLGPGIGG